MSKFNYPLNIPTNGLVGKWDLDGNANDSSGNGNDGTATDITRIPSKKGFTKEVGSFNGSSSEINIGSRPIDRINTVTVWALSTNNDSGDGNNVIYGTNGSRCNMLEVRDNIFKYQLNSDGTNNYIDSGITIELNKWYLYSYSYDGTTVKIYLDGILVGQGDYSYDTSDNYTYKIGTPNDNQYWEGEIGLVKEYNRVLTQNEIQTLYLEGKRKFGDGLLQQYPELFEGCVGYWDFKGDASNLIDGTVATVNGATLTTDHLGNSDSAYNFDGEDDIIDCVLNMTNTQTYVFKLKTTQDTIFYMGAQSGDTVSSKLRFNATDPGDIGIYISDDDAFHFNANVGSSLYDGNWHDIIIIQDIANSTGEVWFDGVSQTVTINDDTLKSYTRVDSWYLGARNNKGTADKLFAGQISYFKLFNDVISASQIKQLYQLTSKKYIYPYARYVPTSLPRPILHINGTHS